MPKVNTAMVMMPLTCPMPMNATTRAASSSVGIVRMMSMTTRATVATTRLPVTLLVHRNANGTPNRSPSDVPTTDMRIVWTRGIHTLAKYAQSGDRRFEKKSAACPMLAIASPKSVLVASFAARKQTTNTMTVASRFHRFRCTVSFRGRPADGVRVMIAHPSSRRRRPRRCGGTCRR